MTQTGGIVGKLDGKVALVSGSTRGIGLGIATRFASEGARVVINGRSEDRVRAVAATIPGSYPAPADVTDATAVNAMVETVVRDLGDIGILVNNAGVSYRAAVTRITDDDWSRVLATNLTGVMYLCRAVVGGMKRNGGGNILNLTSGASYGMVGFSAYGASKGGLESFTLALSKELARFGIRANLLSPSALTDMTQELPDEILAARKDSFATVEAVAETALFLVSDEARYTTGERVRVTGEPPL
jgi:3-oxoacyl-[acyl-carrier protein] reductase